MAENNTNLLLEILQPFDAVPLIIAFCVSVAVGLVLGVVVYMILTWLSRRKAGSANITRRPPHQSRRSRKHPGFHRSHSYDCHSNSTLVGAAFMLHQLTSSSDRFEANLKSGFKGSTFHPPRQSAHTTGEADEESQTCLSPTSAGSVQTRSHGAGTPPRPVSFWGNNGFPTQSPPPAYGSILRAHGEACT